MNGPALDPPTPSRSLLFRSALAAALGGMLFGFDTAVISGTTQDLTDTFHLTRFLLGVTVSSALVGTIFGALGARFPADRYGRRLTLLALAVLYLISALGCGFAFNWPALILFRTLGGLAIGGSSVLGPMYIAEISPSRWRGRLVGLFQFNICTGILLAYLSNYVLSLFSLGAAEWRWKLGASAVPALGFGLLVFAIPESPRWFAARGMDRLALDILGRLGDSAPAEHLREIRESLARERRSKADRLFVRENRFPIFLAITIGIFNQLSGVNAILYYLNDIFQQAGFNRVSGNLQAIAVGATNFLFTLIAMTVIDTLGRKRLLLIGAAGTAVCLGGIASVFLTQSHYRALLYLLIAFIGFFSFSQGAVIWVYLNEIFPINLRAAGSSLGSLTHWLMNAAVSLVYPIVAAHSGGEAFAFFCTIMVVQFIVVLVYYPETKGASLEELSDRMTST